MLTSVGAGLLDNSMWACASDISESFSSSSSWIGDDGERSVLQSDERLLSRQETEVWPDILSLTRCIKVNRMDLSRWIIKFIICRASAVPQYTPRSCCQIDWLVFTCPVTCWLYSSVHRCLQSVRVNWAVCSLHLDSQRSWSHRTGGRTGCQGTLRRVRSEPPEGRLAHSRGERSLYSRKIGRWTSVELQNCFVS